MKHNKRHAEERGATPPSSAPIRRTLVISDAHGHPELIENVLAHAGFRPGMDDLIYAGDFLDRGPDEQGCLDLIERYATEVLVGNHELAVLVGFRLFEQTPESRRFRQLLLDRVLGPDESALWKVATVVDGVLVTHAGISETHQQVFEEECQSDVARFAAYLNNEFLSAVRRELETGQWDIDGVLGDDGPLWFRPPPFSNHHPLANIRQVVGHTPPQLRLEKRGFFMVDACVFHGVREGEFRYGVIQGGQVAVYDGSLLEVRTVQKTVPTVAATTSRKRPRRRPSSARCDHGAGQKRRGRRSHEWAGSER